MQMIGEALEVGASIAIIIFCIGASFGVMALAISYVTSRWFK